MKVSMAGLIAALSLFLATMTSAHATIFDFSITGPNISGSGTLTGVSTGGAYDAVTATGSLTVYGQNITILHASGVFNTGAFQLQLFNDSRESVFFRGVNTGGSFYSSVMQMGSYTAFDLTASTGGGGGAPVPQPGVLLSLLLTGGIVALVIWRRTRTALQ